MKETKPTTPRLRELQVALNQLDHEKDGIAIRHKAIGKVSGYRMAIDDLWPVIEAAQDLVANVGPDSICIFCMVSTWKRRADVQHSADCRIRIFRDALAAVDTSDSSVQLKRG